MTLSGAKDVGIELELDLAIPELDEAIAHGKFKLEKYMLDLVSLFNKKHVVLENLDADIPFAADEAISRAESLVMTLKNEINKLEKSVSELKSSPEAALDKLDTIIERLQMFKELDVLYAQFDVDVTKDPLKLFEYYSRWGVICQEFRDEPLFSNVMRTLLFNLSFRHQDAITMLIEKYSEIFSFRTVMFDETQYYFNVDFHKKIELRTTLEAMERFEILDVEVKKTAEAIMTSFIEPLLRCLEPEKALKIERIDTKLENVYKIGIDRNIPVKNAKCDSFLYLRTLEIFFEKLSESFADLAVDDKSMATIFGTQITPLIFEFISEHILKSAVPCDPQEFEAFQELLDAAEKFHQKMIALGFFNSEIIGFQAHINDYDNIFITRRCSKIIQKTRELSQKIDVEMVPVGNDVDFNVNIATFIDDFKQKVDLNSAGFATPIVNGSHLPKLLQFQRCKIPKNVYELAKLFTDTIDAAVATDNVEAMGKLLVTAYNIMKIYDLITQRHNNDQINSIPLFGALFYNGCHFLNHVMMMKSMSLKQKKIPAELQNHTTFFELVFEFRNRASQALENHLLQLRRQISSFIGAEDPFTALNNEEHRHNASRLIDGSVDLIERIASVWHDVLTEAVYIRAIASLVSHLFSILSNIVLAKEDIHEYDAHEMVYIFEALITRCEKLLTYDDQPHIQNLCEEPYYRFKEITICLSQPLINFADRWCDGIGPLANWLKIDQVKRLIRAIFANSELRAQVLSRIT